jgi:hypothetical protein
MANQARESTEGRSTETLAKTLGSSHHGTRSTNQASGNKPDLSKGQRKKERTTGLNQIEVEEEEWKCKDEINQE